MLLYAQPISRILRLTTDDVIRDGDDVLLRLRTPPSPVREPFAGLLLEHLASRENTMTATNPNCTWLFPGRRAAQPLHPTTLGRQLSTLGITTLPPARPRSANWSCKPPRRSSLACSAITTEPPPSWLPTPAALGATTPPATTPGHSPDYRRPRPDRSAPTRRSSSELPWMGEPSRALPALMRDRLALDGGSGRSSRACRSTGVRHSGSAHQHLWPTPHTPAEQHHAHGRTP
jgi:hypothetical protein